MLPAALTDAIRPAVVVATTPVEVTAGPPITGAPSGTLQREAPLPVNA
jgi:hypothetical protein